MWAAGWPIGEAGEGARGRRGQRRRGHFTAALGWKAEERMEVKTGQSVSFSAAPQTLKRCLSVPSCPRHWEGGWIKSADWRDRSKLRNFREAL